MEFTLIALPLLILALGLIDFANAIYAQQVLTHLSRDGSSLASRYDSTSLSTAASAVLAESAPLNLGVNGRVIVTQVTNNSGN